MTQQLGRLFPAQMSLASSLAGESLGVAVGAQASGPPCLVAGLVKLAAAFRAGVGH